MNRREFSKTTGLAALGLGILPELLLSCKKENDWNVTFNGKVIVLGAGAAGMMAGYFLQQYGIDFEIIEASNQIGGRIKKNDLLADFPIDMGAEWIHHNRKVFSDMFVNRAPSGEMEIIPFSPDTYYQYNGSELQKLNAAKWFYSEYKFKRETWFDFFDQYVVPQFRSKIRLSTPVSSVDYTGNQISLYDNNGNIHQCDRLIVTASTKVLQGNTIGFLPTLPNTFTSALSQCRMPAGLKLFIRFNSKFYPDICSIQSEGSNENIFYDATFKKDTNQNVLGLFTIGDRAQELYELGSDQNIIDNVVKQLDNIFGGEASKNFIKAEVQNWTAEPYVGGSYTFISDSNSVVNELKTPIQGRIFFAGEALAEAQSTVHGAAISGRETVKRILESGPI